MSQTPKHIRAYGALTFICILSMLLVPLFIFMSEAPDGAYLIALAFFFLCMIGAIYFSESIKDWARQAQDETKDN